MDLDNCSIAELPAELPNIELSKKPKPAADQHRSGFAIGRTAIRAADDLNA
jgi:hypothetical protein